MAEETVRPCSHHNDGCRRGGCIRAERLGSHVATYLRYRRGKSPVFNRPCYGYRVICACGEFEQRVNGTKRDAESFWRSHVQQANGG